MAMVGTLIPIGYGDSQHRRLPLPLASYVAGSVAGGLFAGAILGIVGQVILGGGLGETAGGAALAALALTYSVAEARLLLVPIPQVNRQVRQRRHLHDSRPNALAFGYGVGLGAGVLTHMTTASSFLVAAAVVAGGEPATGAAVMGTFGLARSAPLLLVDPGAARGETSLAAATDAIFAWESVVHLLNALALAFAGAMFLAWYVHP
jgi:sulfite exporter TauE/SafE